MDSFALQSINCRLGGRVALEKSCSNRVPQKSVCTVPKAGPKYQRFQTTANLSSHRDSDVHEEIVEISRRETLGFAALTAFLAAIEVPQPANALGAPGLSPPGSDGLSTYTRPALKTGNHGIGWGAIDPYSFKVPAGWEEVGGFAGEGYGGQEVDLKFQGPEGRLEVVLAPIRRFIDPVPANVTIKDIGSEAKVIKAFGSEITGGSPIAEEDVLSSSTVMGPNDRPYYVYDMKLGSTNVLVAATVLRDRAYLISCKASSLQWRKGKQALYGVRDSFYVLDA